MFLSSKLKHVFLSFTDKYIKVYISYLIYKKSILKKYYLNNLILYRLYLQLFYLLSYSFSVVIFKRFLKFINNYLIC